MTVLEMPLDSAPQFFFSLSLSDPSSARMEQSLKAATRLGARPVTSLLPSASGSAYVTSTKTAISGSTWTLLAPASRGYSTMFVVTGKVWILSKILPWPAASECESGGSGQ